MQWWAPLGGDQQADFAATLARIMSESLHGGPVTVFYEDGHGGPWVYKRAPSSNPDWFQQFDGDRAKLRVALAKQSDGRPLNLRRKEDRWLAEVTKRARREGWCASYHGKESPVCVDPEPPLQRAEIAPPRRRVYLVMPEDAAARIAQRASALHETPNRYLNEVLSDHLERVESAAELEASDEWEVPF